jgi:hypothetical protein
MKCPACPVEVRDLHACVRNLLGALDRNEGDRIPRKIEALRRSSERMQVIVDAHFAALGKARTDEHAEEP